MTENHDGLQESSDGVFPMRVNISCLVDDHASFRMQAWNWLSSLVGLKTRCRIFIHHLPGALNETARAAFREAGATLIEIAPFGDGDARYCNKIQQLGTPELFDADFVILSDADMVFLKDPADLVREGVFRAKTVDLPNPPEEIWSELFRQANLADRIGTAELELAPGTETFATNFNGGLYIFPAAMAATLHPLWSKWASYCLSQDDLLGRYTIHADQLGMGMGLAENHLPVDPLPSGANLPTHLPRGRLAAITPQEVSALHYHRHVDAHGLPRDTGVAWIDDAIRQIRASLVEERRRNFLNGIFWDFRYAHFPELGSGLGSRGEVLARKQTLLQPYVEMIGDGSILDVGCGDLEVFAPFKDAVYTGIDVSPEALAIAREKAPHWTFRCGGISDEDPASFDYCFCMDVFIHQKDKETAQALARDLVRVARKGIVFSIHIADIEGEGISFGSADVGEYISELPGVSSVSEIGRYRDVTLCFAELGQGERHSNHDAGLQELAIGYRLAKNPARLKELVPFSRDKVGFFPRTVIRTQEYPWFADQMQDCAGLDILDLGAGVCCLPFYLADRGARVTTVDMHALQRNAQPRETWNEWGYLDYGRLDPRIRSFNMDFGAFKEPSGSYDIIYSVSVIEHMPAETRRAVIARIADLLCPAGRALFSLDLEPGSDRLWNLSGGHIVDETGHGTLDDIRTEIGNAGLAITYEDGLRDVPMSRTDVSYLVCEKER